MLIRQLFSRPVAWITGRREALSDRRCRRRRWTFVITVSWPVPGGGWGNATATGTVTPGRRAGQASVYRTVYDYAVDKVREANPSLPENLRVNTLHYTAQRDRIGWRTPAPGPYPQKD